MAEKKYLTPLVVNALNKPGSYADGKATGLYLRIAPTGTKSWTLRVVHNGKRIERGLGGYPALSIKDARQRAHDERTKLRAGVDPKAERNAARLAYEAAQARAKTFRQCGEAFIEANEINWRNPKHIQQWRNTLAQYAYPIIGDLQVDQVTYAHVLNILDPIWQTKNETARRLRGRIEAVLDWAEAKEFRTEAPNPAALSAKFKAALPAIRKQAGVAGRRGHQRALPWEEAPHFMQRLQNVQGVSAKALMFAILTATRSGECRGAVWEEIDMERATWTIPASRMKSGKEHRVPLSPQAVALLRSVRPQDEEGKVSPTGIIFKGRSGALSDMSLTAVLRRLNVDAVPHGFRSTFRDWTADTTACPRDVAEMALAHVIADSTEAAYRRGDMFAKRRELMNQWATFVSPKLDA